jgi:hypothetical protein
MELLATGDLVKVTYVSGHVRTLPVAHFRKASDEQMATIKEESGAVFSKYMSDVTPVLIVPEGEIEQDSNAISGGKVGIMVLDNKATIPDQELLKAVCSGMEIEVDTIRKPRLAAIDI